MRVIAHINHQNVMFRALDVITVLENNQEVQYTKPGIFPALTDKPTDLRVHINERTAKEVAEFLCAAHNWDVHFEDLHGLFVFYDRDKGEFMTWNMVPNLDLWNLTDWFLEDLQLEVERTW